MKKILFTLLFLFAASLANAQTASYTVQWDPNPAAQNITSYTVTWAPVTGSVQLIQTVTPGNNCTAVVCAVIFNAVPQANWNVSVYGTNDGGNGPPSTIAFSTIPIAPPTAPTGVKIQKVVTGALAAPTAPKLKK
jgi:hypothetical protein